MRLVVCALWAAIGLAASPAFADEARDAAAFWKGVQAHCDVTAKKPATDLGKRIAQSAIDEFYGFGGHEIDANGRIFHFGLTEAEHHEDDSGATQSDFGHLGWWRVMKYWRALYGDKFPVYLEVRGYRGASTATEDTQNGDILRPGDDELLKALDGITNDDTREVLREAAIRAAIIDTSWSAAFISYVVKAAGVDAKAFQFSNAHRAYVYDAFATSTAEVKNESDEHIYRACPLTATKPRVGDIICAHRESKLADLSAAEVRERIRNELDGPPQARTVRAGHCEVVASVDAKARKMYTIGGNVNQAVTVRKLNLRRDMKFSSVQSEGCGGAGAWTLPAPKGAAPREKETCSLNDKKWFVLMQLR